MGKRYEKTNSSKANSMVKKYIFKLTDSWGNANEIKLRYHFTTIKQPHLKKEQQHIVGGDAGKDALTGRNKTGIVYRFSGKQSGNIY